MEEQVLKLKMLDSGLEFSVINYNFTQYSYEIEIEKGEETLESIRELLFNLMRFSAILEDENSDEIGILPCVWESEYYGLDEIEELGNSFLLIFRDTAFKTKEIQKNTADIDYLAMMMDLELE